MQAAQRAECNHALEYAIREANGRKKPLLVFFGITPDFPEANLRHYAFMLEGLRETQGSLAKRGIQMVIWAESPEIGAAKLAEEASLVVVDRAYTRTERLWRTRVADKADCPLVQVETNVVVPVETASSKEEFAARTLRPKIHKHLARFLVPLLEAVPKKDSLGLRCNSLNLDDVERALSSLPLDRSVGPVPDFPGGGVESKRLLADFVKNKLTDYAEKRNDPNADGVSRLSPYLHFGQISPLAIALEVAKRRGQGREAYLEELIVRRELSMNYVYYNDNYDRFEGLPVWCRKTLGEHEHDRREYTYTLAEFEQARTHDSYWNAAQKEMVARGKMHGYMRMYWGKKILDWSRSPEEAFRTALSLNNKYELDGRDPNGFAGVAWCFGKHDRPWFERPIFGKVRYMSAGGLAKKFDADAYVSGGRSPKGHPIKDHKP
jgi:deoxyribodipyrimidine photo-lyase